MRTPSIVLSILAIIALCSFRDSCHSETADAELRKKNRAQEIACIEQDISAKGVRDPKLPLFFCLQYVTGQRTLSLLFKKDPAWPPLQIGGRSGNDEYIADEHLKSGQPALFAALGLLLSWP